MVKKDWNSDNVYSKIISMKNFDGLCEPFKIINLKSQILLPLGFRYYSENAKTITSIIFSTICFY